MTGEERHQDCRHGVFSGHSFRLDAHGVEHPFAMPLCAFKPEGPPAIARVWGGAIDLDRDCVACPVFEALS
jgi:hypothetical protein